MADKKISQLTDGTSLQSGDFVVIARSGDNFKVDPTQFGSSIDVTGTVTADDLIASDGDGGTVSIIRDDATVGINNSLGNITWYSTEDGGSTINQGASIIALAEQNHSTVASGSRLALTTTPIGSTTSLNRLLISNNGDISFYEDTGTTPKFFWDASAESLGIGTSSPSTLLHLQSTNPVIRLQDSDGSGEYAQISGNSASGTLSLQADEGNSASGSIIQFKVDGSEAMRIDASGNLLVGTTTAITQSGTTTGSRFNSDGIAWHIADDAPSLFLGRTSTDGDIVDFRKDGSKVGSIGSAAGSRLFIGNGDTGIRFAGDLDTIVPWNTNNTLRDASIDLGEGVGRFKNLYLSGGVYLGGTGAANLLDDYEEGTFTPSFVDSNGDAAITHDLQGGKYTKIGNVVYFVLVLGTDAVTAGTGNLLVSGLPFTSVNNNQHVSSGSVGLAYEFATAPDRYIINHNDTEIALYSSVNPLVVSTSADMNTSTNDNRLYISGHYFTA